MIKTVIIALALLSPSTLPTKPADTTVGPSLPSIQFIKAMPSAAVKILPELPYEPFPYLPMGSHPNDYAPANCTWGAASMKPSIPNDWGNARDWDDHAVAAGKTVSATPIVGSVAVENDGYYGHVAVVIDTSPGQVEVTEMNYDWHGGVRSYWYAASRFDYIYM